MPSLSYLVFRDFRKDYIPQILDEVYNKRIYEPFVMGRKNLEIADFGANQGLTAFYFAPHAKNLWAVEPSERHLEVLREMVARNGLDNIKVCPYAISNRAGIRKFYHSPNPTSFMLADNVLPDKTDFEEVETVTLDEFFRREQVDRLDILKLDIEGEESKLITSDSFRSLCPKIHTILGEYHDWCGMSKGAFMNTMRDLGYQFEWRTDTQASVFQAVRV